MNGRTDHRSGRVRATEREPWRESAVRKPATFCMVAALAALWLLPACSSDQANSAACQAFWPLIGNGKHDRLAPIEQAMRVEEGIDHGMYALGSRLTRVAKALPSPEQSPFEVLAAEFHRTPLEGFDGRPRKIRQAASQADAVLEKCTQAGPSRSYRNVLTGATTTTAEVTPESTAPPTTTTTAVPTTTIDPEINGLGTLRLKIRINTGWGYNVRLQIGEPMYDFKPIGDPDQTTVEGNWPLHLIIRPTVDDRPSPALEGMALTGVYKDPVVCSLLTTPGPVLGTQMINGQKVCEPFHLDVRPASDDGSTSLDTPDDGSQPVAAPELEPRTTAASYGRPTWQMPFLSVHQQQVAAALSQGPDYWLLQIQDVSGLDLQPDCTTTAFGTPSFSHVYKQDGTPLPTSAYIRPDTDGSNNGVGYCTV